MADINNGPYFDVYWFPTRDGEGGTEGRSILVLLYCEDDVALPMTPPL